MPPDLCIDSMNPSDRKRVQGGTWYGPMEIEGWYRQRRVTWTAYRVEKPSGTTIYVLAKQRVNPDPQKKPLLVRTCGHKGDPMMAGPDKLAKLDHAPVHPLPWAPKQEATT